MTIARIPLLAHGSPEAVVAYRAGRPIPARQFLADARVIAALLPGGGHVLNACADRYRFAVGLAACLIAGKTSLLPSTHVPEVIRHLRAFAPDAFCLTDDEASEIELPLVRYPAEPVSPTDDWRVPEIAGGQRVAYVFTSGSTGKPLPHQKTWARLVANVRVEAERLGFDDRRRRVVVATVPPQHMYGFESSVLLALQSGQAFCAERPFYPADIADVLAGVPRARVLVSTPVHLRALLASEVALPELDLVVCATAPLDAAIAVQVQERFGAPLLEIYGSTETGQIASRRTAECAEWQLWPGVALDQRDGRTWAEGGHLEAPTPLGDVVDMLPAGRFLLRGRTEDLVNIAGNRSSIAYLNHQLNAISGVVDGAFFLPQESADRSATGTARLAAIVVAPGLTAEAILRELRDRVNPVFLPRPLLLVDRMPRNATGKLPRAVLKSLTVRARPDSSTTTVTEIPIPPDHPAFAGHFPGSPIVPGVVLLDAALDAIASARGVALERCTLTAVKFKSIVRPGERVTLHFERTAPESARFELNAAGRPVASGALTFKPVDGPTRGR